MHEPERGGDHRPAPPPQRPHAPQRGVGNVRPIERPNRDDRGRDLPGRDREMRYGPDHDRARRTIDNDRFGRDRERWEREERENGRWYWHDHDGWRSAHRWDGRRDWWGFYWGDAFYWTVWYGDSYWWYDPYWGRWCWRREGRWWWHDGRVVYVYDGGVYYRYDDGVGGVILVPTQPDTTPVDPSVPAPAPVDPSEEVFISADGTRSVQIVGAERYAYLYDRTQQDADGNDQLIAVLASGVESVQFTQADGGLPSVTLTLLQDGQEVTRAFDANGNSLDEPAMPVQVESAQQTELKAAQKFVGGLSAESLGSMLK